MGARSGCTQHTDTRPSHLTVLLNHWFFYIIYGPCTWCMHTHDPCLGVWGSWPWVPANNMYQQITPPTWPPRHIVYHTQSMMPSKFEMALHYNGPKGLVPMHQNHWFQPDVTTQFPVCCQQHCVRHTELIALNTMSSLHKSLHPSTHYLKHSNWLFVWHKCTFLGSTHPYSYDPCNMGMPSPSFTPNYKTPHINRGVFYNQGGVYMGCANAFQLPYI